jgi:hypothetical protein
MVMVGKLEELRVLTVAEVLLRILLSRNAFVTLEI